MVGETGSHDWRDRQVREWLLLLLRFAITREQSDRSAVLAMADELDSRAHDGARTRRSSFIRQAGRSATPSSRSPKGTAILFS